MCFVIMRFLLACAPHLPSAALGAIGAPGAFDQTPHHNTTPHTTTPNPAPQHHGGRWVEPVILLAASLATIAMGARGLRRGRRGDGGGGGGGRGGGGAGQTSNGELR